MQPSIQNAYAQLSAPPPNLPPRRNPPRNGQASSSGTSQSQYSNNTSRSSSTVGTSSTVAPPPGAPDLPPRIPEESALGGSGGSELPRHRPEAEKEVALRASDRTPIWSTHFIDPCLRDPVINIPHHVTNITNAALSGLGNNSKEKYNRSVGTPIDGLAKKAQQWVVTPDGRFQSENGGIDLGVGIIDGGTQGWGRDKGRSRGRVEVTSRSGGIKVEVVRGIQRWD